MNINKNMFIDYDPVPILGNFPNNSLFPGSTDKTSYKNREEAHEDKFPTKDKEEYIKELEKHDVL